MMFMDASNKTKALFHLVEGVVSICRTIKEIVHKFLMQLPDMLWIMVFCKLLKAHIRKLSLLTVTVYFQFSDSSRL